jgi:uncharacterized membrane protein
LKFFRYFFSFLMGFFIYSLLEVAGRGYTHWTMALCGGAVLAAVYGLSGRVRLIGCCACGALITTGLELIVGIFDNLIMGWQVWDYSDMPLNFLGQICLPFSAGWFVLCAPAYFLCKNIRRRLTDQ